MSTGGICDNAELGAQDSRHPRATTAPMRVVSFVVKHAPVYSPAAEHARMQYEALRSMVGNLQELNDKARLLHDAWIRVYNDALIHHMDPRDDINLENLIARFQVVMSAIQAKAPIPPSCRNAVEQRAKEAPEREARQNAAREAGRNADPFSVVFEQPAPTSGSASIDGVYRTTPALQAERRVEAAQRVQAAGRKKDEEKRKVVEAGTTRKSQQGGAALKKTTAPNECAVREPFDSVAVPLNGSRPQIRVQKNYEAENIVHPSSDRAPPEESKDKPESDQEEQEGHRSVDRDLDSNQKGQQERPSIEQSNAEKRPITGFAATLTLTEVEWINQWWEDWKDLKIDHQAARDTWRKNNPTSEKVWAWYLSGRDDFNATFGKDKNGQVRQGGEMSPSFLKNSVQRGELEVVLMDRRRKKREESLAKEAKTGGKAKATELPKSKAGPAERPKRLREEDDEDTRHGSATAPANGQLRPKRIRLQPESRSISAGPDTVGPGYGSAATLNDATRSSKPASGASKARAAKGLITTSRKRHGKDEEDTGKQRRSLIVVLPYKGSFPPTPKRGTDLKAGIDPSAVDGDSDEEMTR